MVQYMELESQRVQKYSRDFRLKHRVSDFEDVKKSIDDLNADGICTLDELEQLQEVKCGLHSS
ncbi:MAG: hypothetical protein LIP12_10840 [Clostridiales bacterium]|nr:hypothetical protein [Clostridiales bacterium]